MFGSGNNTVNRLLAGYEGQEDGLNRRTSRFHRDGEWGESAADLPCALPPPWMKDGKCNNYPNLDFMDRAGHREQRVCSLCPVRAECLQYAIDNKLTIGMWGGLTAEERAALRTATEKPKCPTTS